MVTSGQVRSGQVRYSSRRRRSSTGSEREREWKGGESTQAKKAASNRAGGGSRRKQHKSAAPAPHAKKIGWSAGSLHPSIPYLTYLNTPTPPPLPLGPLFPYYDPPPTFSSHPNPLPSFLSPKLSPSHTLTVLTPPYSLLLPTVSLPYKIIPPHRLVSRLLASIGSFIRHHQPIVTPHPALLPASLSSCSSTRSRHPIAHLPSLLIVMVLPFTD